VADGARAGRSRSGAAAEALLFLAVTVGICAVLMTVFFSHRSPKALTPVETRAAPLTRKVLLIVVDALRTIRRSIRRACPTSPRRRRGAHPAWPRPRP
jgi:hypothetical protein